MQVKGEIMTKFKGILFDYGHTLVGFPHYKEVHLKSVRNIQRKLQTLGFSVETSRIRALIDEFAHRRKSQGVGMDAELRDILSGLGVAGYSEDDLQQIIELHWRPYVQNARARKGAKYLLNRLKSKGFKLGIVANIWSGGMNPALEKLGLDGSFDTMIASVDVGHQKPDPETFQLALKHLRLRAQETIMVGDNPTSDIQGAHNLGMCTVRLMRGPNRAEPDKVAADFKIKNLSKLVNIVCVS
ncbi:MAG: HAD family hydrolase [Candidatus Bathyarchaeia archaeon]